MQAWGYQIFRCLAITRGDSVTKKFTGMFSVVDLPRSYLKDITPPFQKNETYPATGERYFSTTLKPTRAVSGTNNVEILFERETGVSAKDLQLIFAKEEFIKILRADTEQSFAEKVLYLFRVFDKNEKTLCSILVSSPSILLLKKKSLEEQVKYLVQVFDGNQATVCSILCEKPSILTLTVPVLKAKNEYLKSEAFDNNQKNLCSELKRLPKLLLYPKTHIKERLKAILGAGIPASCIADGICVRTTKKFNVWLQNSKAKSSPEPEPLLSQGNAAAAVAKSILKVPKKSNLSQEESISLDLWTKAFHDVSGMSFSESLVEKAGRVIGLKSDPTWVDSKSGALEELDKFVMNTGNVVAVDSEFTNDAISTFQIAIHVQGDIRTYIFDFLDVDREFRDKCIPFFEKIFENKIVLGFSVNADIQRLEQLLGNNTILSRDKVLDLQHLSETKNQVSLKKMVEQCCSTGLRLKKKPCKGSPRNWKERPLDPLVLEYAGLDAAVLLAVLAEKARQQEDGRHLLLQHKMEK